MIKRALQWLFPRSPYRPNEWGNANDIRYNRSEGAIVGALLVFVLFAVIVAVASVLL